MKCFLLRYADTLADEMNIEGFTVMDEEEKDHFFEVAERYFKEIGYYSYYVGSNQSIDYKSYQVFKSCITVKELEADQLKSLEKMNLGNCGFFPYFNEGDLNNG